MYQKIYTLLRTVLCIFRFSTTLVLLVSRGGYWADRERSVSSTEGRRQLDGLCALNYNINKKTVRLFSLWRGFSLFLSLEMPVAFFSGEVRTCGSQWKLNPDVTLTKTMREGKAQLKNHQAFYKATGHTSYCWDWIFLFHRISFQKLYSTDGS